MDKKYRNGLPGILARELSKKSHEGLVEEALAARMDHGQEMLAHIETKETERQHRVDGGNAKAATFAPKKQLFGNVFWELAANRKKPPTLKQILTVLDTRDPSNTYTEGGVKEWFTQLRTEFFSRSASN